MTKPSVPDDQPAGNGQVRYARGPGQPDDPVTAQRARLASMWARALASGASRAR